MRHVRQKFRLILRSQGELFCLLFQGSASLLDFLVLAFHFGILLGELFRFLGKLLVGLLQLLLLRLQLDCQLLRLLQQPFGLHGGFNAIQHNANTRSQLLQEGEVRGGESVQTGQLDDSLDTIFKENRQNDNVARNCLE